MLVRVKVDHTLGLVAGSFVAPGYAQAVVGRRRAALVWAALVVAGTVLATCSIWIPLGLFALHLAAAVAALSGQRRFAGPPGWWRTLPLIVFVIGIASVGAVRLQLAAYRIPSSSMYPTLEIGDHIFVDRLSVLWRAPERGEVIVFRYPCDEQRDYIKRVVAVGGDTVEVRCNILYVNGTAIESRLVDAHASYRERDEMDGRWFSRTSSRYRETLGGHTYDVFHDPERPERDAQRDTLAAGDVRDFPRRELPFPPSCRQTELYDLPAGAAAPRPGKLVETKPLAVAGACEPQLHYVVPAGGLFVLGDNRSNANDSRVWGTLAVDAVIGRVLGIWINDPPGAGRNWSRVGALE